MPKKVTTKTTVKKSTAVAKKPAAIVKKPTAILKPKAETKAKAVKPKIVVPEVKSELVKKYRSGAKDTGSVAVQIALLTDRITALAKHLTKHIHDFDSKRGLLILVGKRRGLLNYLRKSDEKVYAKLVKDLKLKK